MVRKMIAVILSMILTITACAGCASVNRVVIIAGIGNSLPHTPHFKR